MQNPASGPGAREAKPVPGRWHPRYGGPRVLPEPLSQTTKRATVFTIARHVHSAYRGAEKALYFFSAVGATVPAAASLALRSSCNFSTCSFSLAISFSETFRYRVEFLGL